MKAPCAGIAMGLVVEGSNYSILTDIAGAEDHYGDMDFKSCRHAPKAITALQMDIKVTSISIGMMREALASGEESPAGDSRHHGKKTLSAHRENISLYAPRLYKLSIPTDKIRDLIGPGWQERSGPSSSRPASRSTSSKTEPCTSSRPAAAPGGGSGRCKWFATSPPAPKLGQNVSRAKVVPLGGIRRIRRTLPGHRRLAAH